MGLVAADQNLMCARRSVRSTHGKVLISKYLTCYPLVRAFPHIYIASPNQVLTHAPRAAAKQLNLATSGGCARRARRAQVRAMHSLKGAHDARGRATSHSRIVI